MFDWKRPIIVLAICMPGLLLAQDGPAKDFSLVDSLARTVKYRNDIYRLTASLTDGYTSNLFKARSIFIWITDNIKYDYRFYNKGADIKPPKCRKGKDCNLLVSKWENRYLHKVLTKKRGVCDAYSRLFKKMCDIAGIKADIITGYTKTKPYQIGSSGPVNHAWNAILLDSTYYFVDATWAAGTCPEDENTEKLTGFNKKYNDYYWLISFEELSKNHYPKDARWVTEVNYSRERFAANPYYSPHIIESLRLISPSSGIIKASKGDTIHFKFAYADRLKYLQVNSNSFRNPDIYKWEGRGKRRMIRTLDSVAIKKQQFISYARLGDIYEFDYIIESSSLDYLELLFDFQRALKFRIDVKRD